MRKIGRFEMYDRVIGSSDWVMYIHDYYWALQIDGYFEFYYNPLLYLGRIKASDMPAEAIDRMKRSCRVFTPKDRDSDHGDHMKKSKSNLSIARMPIKSGNVFYAMGAWCATMKKQFFFEDPYTGEVSVCDLKEMSWFSVDCMMRMSAMTKTFEYFRDITDLGCFRGMDIEDFVDREL